MGHLRLLLAQAEGGASAPNILASFFPILLIVGVFYLLIYRPMRSRQKNLENMVANLKNGDKIITNGGVYGTVTGIRENTLMVKISDQVKIEIAKSAVAALQQSSKD